MSTNNTAKLQQMESEYRQRIDAIDRDLSQKSEADFAEQATQRENDDVLAGLLAEAQVELVRVDAALERMDRGVYGRCVKCGTDIIAERLAALPQADMCRACVGL